MIPRVAGLYESVISREVGLRFEKPWAEHFSLRFIQCVVELAVGVHLFASITWVRKFGSPVEIPQQEAKKRVES